MLVVFPPIFVGNTKIIYGYNFVGPLIETFVNRFPPYIGILLWNIETDEGCIEME